MPYNCVLFLMPLALVFADYAPILSTSGKQKVLDNLATLNKNMTQVNGNIVNCEKNATVIESEIKELSALEKEHLHLKEKYSEQLSSIEIESIKNANAIKELDKFQNNIIKNAATASGAGSPHTQQEDLIRSRKDKEDRENWQKEAKEKIEKLSALIKNVNTNLNSIHAKAAPLQEQLLKWQKKEKEYKKLLSTLVEKKVESEKILKTQK